jgi:hypothetical protein
MKDNIILFESQESELQKLCERLRKDVGRGNWCGSARLLAVCAGTGIVPNIQQTTGGGESGMAEKAPKRLRGRETICPKDREPWGFDRMRCGLNRRAELPFELLLSMDTLIIQAWTVVVRGQF